MTAISPIMRISWSARPGGQNEFAKSKGWIKAYYILSNNNPRKDEPDLYLVTVSDQMPTPAEQIAREQGNERVPAEVDDRKGIAGRAVSARPIATWTATCFFRSWCSGINEVGAPCDCAALRLSP